MISDCIPFRDNQSCVAVTNSGLHSDFFTPASRCEGSGGRLLWLHDVSIIEFIHNQLQTLITQNCENCYFLWIGLLQSINDDKLYFWKRSRKDTIKQCHVAISTTKCLDNVSQTECELLGCCYRKQSCFYPDNVTKDFLNEHVDFNISIVPIHQAENASYRHCVGLQRNPFGNR